MKRRPLIPWTLANAIGLGTAFVAMLQIGMFLKYGLDFEKHWQFVPSPPPPAWGYVGMVANYLVAGALFGGAQALVLRGRPVRVGSWILSTAVGFGFLAAVIAPLTALGIWGRIPGPVEPISFTVGGGIVAGILQHLSLRRQGIVAAKWLALWVVGLIVSLVPMAITFMSLEGLGLLDPLGWPMEVFLTGLLVAGVAALISGKALSTVLGATTPLEGWPRPAAAGTR
jgi:uncharacterized membrane protein